MPCLKQKSHSTAHRPLARQPLHHNHCRTGVWYCTWKVGMRSVGCKDYILGWSVVEWCGWISRGRFSTRFRSQSCVRTGDVAEPVTPDYKLTDVQSRCCQVKT
ncbi:hypothetical protein MPTK1_1g18550 [Marchantia polymorpha subsp. ruderalis]|uniref:Uncharacterized protein n=2 Tax=Marchantia polymorpha TaxID=3197 RepID=A0AAF6ARL1_MARPO|nr:hypothetical protein MARPO_0001s0193 [Marchantia polymorpha]BBM99081.1 hypothetical protein Mp_1g18550 [Marchantia polymorpha subsp. ruderalis]|eukprot:PTQ50158.1 hypothetical protein MARPO_0001s0193 [Marchantia polymorpha]